MECNRRQLARIPPIIPERVLKLAKFRRFAAALMSPYDVIMH
jgi:hypothetical protein